MEHYRRTAHTRFDIKYHLVWIRSTGSGGCVKNCNKAAANREGYMFRAGDGDHQREHRERACPSVRIVSPHVSSSQLMQRIKKKSSRKLLREFSHLKRQCWGRHLWARGFFVVGSRNITDEMIIEYINLKIAPKKMKNSKLRTLSRAFGR